MPSPEMPDDGMIYINELAKIINRKKGTIRKWEREERLPKRLMPKRGFRKWRCWTPAQVHGKNGIIVWMKKNDMRPGNTFADPDHEDAHLEALRQQRILNGHNIRSAYEMAKVGRTRDQIIKRIFPATPYYERIERALEMVFEERDWELPPPGRRQRNRNVELSKADKAEIERLSKAAQKILSGRK